MAKTGNIFYTKKDFTDLEVASEFTFPVILILHDNNSVIKKITAFDENGNKTIYDFSLAASKDFVTQSIETIMLSMDSRSQQISLSSIFRVNQDGNPNKIDVTSGQLFSQALFKTWSVSALVTTLPDNNFRYIYAKASKTNTTASIFITSDKITFDSDPNYYYFLIGILHSVVDGERVLSVTVGTATISGGLVRTGIISSLDGQTTFNLNTGEIKGKITFSSGSSGYENLTDKPDLSSFEATRDYVNTTLQTDLDDLKNRADGVIESWFYSHTPTLSNLPAINWVTTEERNAHIGDTFTNMQEFVDNATTPDAGKAWRFVKNETTGEFSWSLIANSDSTKALIEAGKAKDTADAKRRVFVSQPYPPYNVGDLWVQGNGGDIMRCKFERLSGSYVASDFEKASKYTDDTAVNNLQIGGRNLVRNSAQAISNASYLVASYNLSQPLNDGVYTIRIKGTFSTGDRPRPHIGGIGVEDYGAGTIQNGIYIKTFNYDTRFGNNTNLTIYRAVTDSNPMVIEWIKLEKGNKATDWTPAPEDVDNAINTAQTSANTANSLLSDISSDSILSPSEKQSTKKEWDIIVSEKTTVETQATSLGVSATLYNSAYNSLDTYITPLLTDLTTNSAIDGATFRAKFRAYYDAKISLLKDVTDKLKSNTDNIQVGGRNLFSLSRVNFILNTIDKSINGYVCNYYSYNTMGRISKLGFNGIGGDFTVSCYLKADRNINVDVNLCDIQAENSNTSLTTSYVKHVFVFKNVFQYTGTPYFGFLDIECQDSSAKVYVKDIKIERGNKATDWTPAPEEVDDRITAEAQKIIALEGKTNFLGSTTIDGNVVATGTLLVGNEAGTNAGLTGTGDTNDGVYLWGGGTYQQMVQGLAKKEQRRNGVDIWRHPNGQIGFEIGIKDGRLIFNGYHSDGFKLFELDPNRGLIAVSYTQESWTQTPLRKLNYTSSTFNESTIASEISGFISKNQEQRYLGQPPYDLSSDYVYISTYNVTENYVGYDYDNGTNPTNSSYESLKGMKANNNDRNTNIPNGWYMLDVGMIYQDSEYNNFPPSTYTFTVLVYYYTNGKITDTRVVTITK